MAKILIAEDDKFLANAYRVKLSKEGFEVKLASDGEEALQMISEFKPDLALLDIIMPKKDGFMVLEEIRKMPEFVNLPIIIASNLGQSEDIERGKRLGATDYIIKSNLSLVDLIIKIKSYLA